MTLDKLNMLLEGWDDLAADKSFAGMTLAEFQAKVKPSLDARKDIKDLDAKMTDATTRRQISDVETLRQMQWVVSSIKGDPAFGDDSALYEAAGYVRKSERKSGLSRKAKAATTQVKSS